MNRRFELSNGSLQALCGAGTLLIWLGLAFALYPIRGLIMPTEIWLSLTLLPVSVVTAAGIGALVIFHGNRWSLRIAGYYAVGFFLVSCLWNAAAFKFANRYADLKSDLLDAEIRTVCDLRFEARPCIAILNQCPSCTVALTPLTQKIIRRRLVDFRDRLDVSGPGQSRRSSP